MTTDNWWETFKSGVLGVAAEYCRFEPVGMPPGGQKRTSWCIREVQLALKETAAFKKWLGNKEPPTHLRYVDACEAAAKAVAKGNADSWEKFG
ncbi:unnamed protein product [Soboliphyme baturini]|uniref:DUF982 domain-containing protein n=1 Tax=Soboliphyme baturini TaxID=241478 RepID=A0A183J9D6_9BILA|nr:unnamed protein product [Soboliphyme baturini]